MVIDAPIAPYGLKDGQFSNTAIENFNTPNPTQQRVLDWADNIRAHPIQDHIPILYLQGGVGSGKSRAFMAVVLEALTQLPGIRILWLREDFKDLKLSILDKFLELMPPELIVDRSEQYHWYDIKQPNGTTGRIYFNNAKDIGGLGSQEFGIIVATEAHEMSEQSYWAIKRRCRQENQPNMILLESEAPNEKHWLDNLTNTAYPEYDQDIEKWVIETYENWHNLPKAYTGSLDRMPEAWKRKYLKGLCGFIPDGKPYYQGFKEFVHTGLFDWIPSKEIILGWDFGYHHPACLITQIDQQDHWIWLREIIGNEITIDLFAEQVKAVINEYYPNAQMINFGDPACMQVNDKSPFTSWQILKSKGFNVRFKQSQYTLRKEIIEQKLSTLINGMPTVMLDMRFCKTSIDGFLGGYHYPEFKNGQSFTDKFELPVKDGYYEHIMNAGEYIAVNMFSPIRIKPPLRQREEAPKSRDNI
jgi:hypothetical protein